MALDRIDLSNVNVCIMGSNVGGVGIWRFCVSDLFPGDANLNSMGRGGVRELFCFVLFNCCYFFFFFGGKLSLFCGLI